MKHGEEFAVGVLETDSVQSVGLNVERGRWSSLRRERIAYEMAKRLFDIVCSLLALIALSPVFAITALAIKLEDGGSPIFAQTRIGKNGKPFKMYKFRSMCVNAEKKLEELQSLNEADGPVFKIEKDPRITKVGEFIRKTSIDELPQLINILKGDMSIVGPRPPLENEVKEYNAYQRGRLAVKPGLTCYWQCSGRSNIGFDQWVELDLKYIRERGFFKDIEIILRTVPAVLFHKGAY